MQVALHDDVSTRARATHEILKSNFILFIYFSLLKRHSLKQYRIGCDHFSKDVRQWAARRTCSSGALRSTTPAPLCNKM